MGFWSSLGKGLLKIAPIAAAFIPGVGPLASMAIGAGSAAASKKLSGGSTKDALLSGATGGLSGYAGAKSIGPSSNAFDKIKAGMGGMSNSSYRTPPFVPSQGNQGDFGRFAGDMADILGRYSGSSRNNVGIGPSAGRTTSTGRTQQPMGEQIYSGRLGRRLGVQNQVDQSAPNLSYALAQGKAEALRNRRRQPSMMIPWVSEEESY